MSIYPSLEDMKVDQMTKAQTEIASEMMHAQAYHQAAPSAPAHTLPYPTSPMAGKNDFGAGYPDLVEYMGIEFTPEILAANMPEYLPVAQQHNTVAPYVSAGMVAPISAQSKTFEPSQVTHGIRQLLLCKSSDGKIGMRVKAIDQGIFVCLVKRNSPAALAGLRFGDQLLQINERNLAGCSMDKVHTLLRKAPSNNINVAVRDRPFERTVTLHKDSTNHVGFQFREGQINAIVKDSSAARNGLLTNHHILEVNGQNVVGLNDSEITKIMASGSSVVTVCIMPSYLYKHVVDKMASSLLTKLMDHSTLEI